MPGSGSRLPLVAAVLLATGCSDTSGPEEEQGLAVTLVEAHRNATCALTEDGTAFCWGVPTGEFTCSDACLEVPVPVTAPAAFNTLEMGGSLFGEAVCGLSASGAPHCWGSLLVNLDGAANLGAQPTLLQNAVSLGTVSIGIGHICGVGLDTKSYCWGDFDGARRGQEIPSVGGTGTDFVPNVVRGEHAFTALQASAWNTCGIDASRAVWCWGSGHLLGNPAATLETDADLCGYGVTCSFDPVPIAGGQQIASFAGRDGCGITPAGALICWDAGYGDPPRAPAAVALPVPVTRAVAGAEHECVLDTDGAAWCWGSNEHGQLGLGAVASAAAPTKIPGELRFRWLTAGELHTCGVTTDAALYCWGANDSGQLGTGGRASAREPARVLVSG